MTTALRFASIPALAAVAAAVLLLPGCCSSGRPREVTAEEFVRLASMPIGSAHDSRFLGAAGKRAYLVVWSAATSSASGGDRVYSVAVEELPADIAQQIRAGVDPWPKP